MNTKIVPIILTFPLTVTFFVKNCTHQRQRVSSQANDAISKMDSAQIGLWGGEHIRLEVTAQGGQVEYDCAHGTIDQQIVLDRQGRFDVRGTHVREHGGPIRKDEISDSHPAQFSGQISGTTMTLSVTETDTKEIVGTFTLVYGQKPHIVKCR
jgi:hypothetical protein